MINLNDVKELADKHGLEYEEFEGTKYIDKEVTARKIKVSSSDYERNIVFYEWFEKPFKDLKAKRFGEVHHIRNNLPSINAAYNDGVFMLTFENALRFRLYEETLEDAFEWLLTGDTKDYQVIRKDDLSIKKERDFSSWLMI